jgi:quinol monooxygenase YgiN
VWANQKAFEGHESAEHSKNFREKLQQMLGSPFDERLHHDMK